MASLTPSQRSLRARVAAFALHAQGRTTTGPATAGFLARFEREVIEAAAAGGEQLAQEEVTRRAGVLRKAHMTRLALASSRARPGKAALAGEEPRAAAEARHHGRGERPTAA